MEIDGERPPPSEPSLIELDVLLSLLLLLEVFLSLFVVIDEEEEETAAVAKVVPAKKSSHVWQMTEASQAAGRNAQNEERTKAIPKNTTETNAEM